MAKATGIILAGGVGTRLGRNKAFEVVQGRPLIQWVVDRLALAVREIVVVKAASQALCDIETPLPLTIVEDAVPGTGPLGGIYTGLLAASCDLSFAAACDMPLLSLPLVEELIGLAEGYDVVLPLRAGRPQPLHAVYRKTCIDPMRRELDAGNLRVVSFLPAVRVRYVRVEEWARFDPEGTTFANVNTEDDLRRVASLLQ